MVNEYSCVCLHGDRRPQERKENLLAFKVSLWFSLSDSHTPFQNGEVRFLICTDVAARGIDIRGIPYVVNVTLPDDKQNYIHRIGRVGRAERMGLAISLVAKNKEKVWSYPLPNILLIGQATLYLFVFDDTLPNFANWLGDPLPTIF